MMLWMIDQMNLFLFILYYFALLESHGGCLPSSLLCSDTIVYNNILDYQAAALLIS